ncbi:sigma-54-dependent transcriptional regulator [Sediminibacterium soli]|uniref:sigma-54-dependent transcriptional regulator n=1 Tax=Sediminibacterium soli TaxID=2698829 RepID=UPI00137968C6|nr:sigma-54 dependent transcriptional regulator [Sediminibacterium soli]NCI45908.1 sigma-54-dependent Fis family transcriptional regulator [Sediminibacterium soli]
MQRILIVDDDRDLCFLLNRFLMRKGYQVTVIYSGTEAMQHLVENEPDLLISDLGLGDIDGITLLNKAKELYPNLPVIIITGFSDIKLSALAMRQGAFDYVMKPLLPEQMLLSVQDALESRKRGAAAPGGYFDEKDTREYYFWGSSDASRKLIRQVHLVAPTNHNLIIYGEDGTGKRALAHEIHKLSKRSHLPFVMLNAASVPAKHTSVYLFGRLAETGGVMQEEEGLLDQVNGGTLYIANPQELPIEIQQKLLQCIRKREWTREGSDQQIEMDIRFFASSNTLLWEAARKAVLLEELYHRFNEFTIHIPPLRERKEDIQELANHFLKMNNDALGTNSKGLTPEATAVLGQYTWHDNIRELKNFIQKASLQCSGHYIGIECLPAEISRAGSLLQED